ncbi:MAG: family 43 glycosylhydrolase, partial [Phycisphaerales bacterium]
MYDRDSSPANGKLRVSDYCLEIFLMKMDAIYSMIFGVLVMLPCAKKTCGGSVNRTWKLSDIRIRDPFILAEETTQTYYMYAQMDNRRGRKGHQKGVEVYTSKDLQQWAGPYPVFVIGEDFWADRMVWAPEVHEYGGRYYLFVTFTAEEPLEPIPGRPPLVKRGTQILVSDSPEGPFKPFENRPHTPLDWMALDGTLWVEDGTAWMVFCHEWVQIRDGTMELVRLKEDLSTVQGRPVTLF